MSTRVGDREKSPLCELDIESVSERGIVRKSERQNEIKLIAKRWNYRKCTTASHTQAHSRRLSFVFFSVYCSHNVCRTQHTLLQLT